MMKTSNKSGKLELSKLQAKTALLWRSEHNFVATSADSQKTRHPASRSRTTVFDFRFPSPHHKAGCRLSDEEKKRLIASIPTRGVSTKPY